MAHPQTRYINGWYKEERRKLVAEFGAKCRYCERPDIDFSDSPLARKLEFVHKVNERISGMSRGRNSRIAEIRRDPSRFWLGCKSCHGKYDVDHPLTKEERRKMDEEPPF